MIRIKWLLWVFPSIAVALSAILLFRTFNGGLKIKISFLTAEGIQPGRTSVKFRGVTIGRVDSVQLTDKGVVAIITMDKDQEKFAVEGTRFWLVEPQFSFQGVTGLSTIREGNYIGVEPGDSERTLAKDFVATNSPRQSAIQGPYNTYNLTAFHLGSVSSGDPVFFRGFPIGQVISVGLSEDYSSANVHIGIMQKYISLIRSTSVFWRKQAVQADLSIFGSSEINIGSLESLIKGGIETSFLIGKSAQVRSGTIFALSDKNPQSDKSSYDGDQNIQRSREIHKPNL